MYHWVYDPNQANQQHDPTTLNQSGFNDHIKFQKKRLKGQLEDQNYIIECALVNNSLGKKEKMYYITTVDKMTNKMI